MTYHDPGCAYCPPTVRACRQGESGRRGPGFCPSKVDDAGLDEARARYDDPEVRRIAQASALVESEGYCRWTRVEEICEFARKLGYRKIGIATCISFVDLAHDDQKIRPGGHESMCNPIAQAELLNRAGCELNVVLGLCVGHDSLFFRHSTGLATTLVAKDRVLGHNPVAALQLADTYYQRVWGSLRPPTRPVKPVEGRRPA
jgi:uncharacterized metal-binding protein